MNASYYSQVLSENSVYIMGLGWLGLPLAHTLAQIGVRVAGCVRSHEKQSLLQNASLNVDNFDLYKSISEQHTCVNNPLSSRFAKSSLILNIPPGRNNFNKELFVSRMLSLIDYAMQSGLKHLIFISTTSVFGNAGETINNSSSCSAKTESGKAHQSIEEHLALHYQSRSTILRPSGLVGPTISNTTVFDKSENALAQNNKQQSEKNFANMRHPIFSLCHKKNIPNGKDPVNLIHQVDVIHAILAVLHRSLNSKWETDASACSHALNLSACEHPSRQEYYQWCARHLSLPVPHFLPDTKKRQLGKLIDASSSFTELGFDPAFASPYDMF